MQCSVSCYVDCNSRSGLHPCLLLLPSPRLSLKYVYTRVRADKQNNSLPSRYINSCCGLNNNGTKMTEQGNKLSSNLHPAGIASPCQPTTTKLITVFLPLYTSGCQCIIMGIPIPLGTGLFKLLMNEDKIKPPPTPELLVG